MVEKQTALHQQSERMESDRLGHRVAEFLKNWRPADPREAHEFEAEFFSLVQAIHHAAAKPFIATFTAAVSAAPWPPILGASAKADKG